MPLIWDVPAEGSPLSSEEDARDLLGESYGSGAEVIAIPVGRLSHDFWTLSNKKAGLFIQKLVNYGMRVAIVGDISGHTAKSQALRDFVTESNRRGRELVFVADRAGLHTKLG